MELLETLDVVERLSWPSSCSASALAEAQVRQRIRDDVESGTQKQQREYFLRKQMDSIRKELGEDDASIVDEYRTKIDEAGMPDDVREQAERELGRLERMGEPARRVLDDPHLPRLADRRAVVEALRGAPRPRARARGAGRRPRRPGGRQGPHHRVPGRAQAARRTAASPRTSAPGAILTLIGPPGTGKTSIGESIARATGREFVRMSLGGVRDEAEIRGHRRTYIGALPGRLVRALRDAGTMNPVIMLDEVDKVGADWRGDPSSALLEVLDPAQNHSFRDHYLDVELDLSQVLFIATANVADTIPGPLLDRMEVIRFDGYTTEEKLAIARGYLWPRQSSATACCGTRSRSPTTWCARSITEYTREAGVRQLERELGTVLRKTATRIASGKAEAPVDGRRSTPCATPSGKPEVLPGGRHPHGGAGRGHRPGGHRHRAATCCSSRPPR